MKKIAMSMALILGASMAAQASVIYSQDFSASTNTYLRYGDGYAVLGGSTANSNHREIDFGEWAGGSGQANAVVTDGAMQIQGYNGGTGGTRGIGVVIDPTLFGGVAGTYTFKFDLKISGQDGTEKVYADVWAGSGYNLEETTDSKRIALDTANARGTRNFLAAVSGAAASNLAESTYTSDIAAFETKTVDFTYDGTSAVALLFTADGGVLGTIDNVQVIPEPATLGLIALTSVGLLVVRRFQM